AGIAGPGTRPGPPGPLTPLWAKAGLPRARFAVPPHRALSRAAAAFASRPRPDVPTRRRAVPAWLILGRRRGISRRDTALPPCGQSFHQVSRRPHHAGSGRGFSLTRGGRSAYAEPWTPCRAAAGTDDRTRMAGVCRPGADAPGPVPAGEARHRRLPGRV